METSNPSFIGKRQQHLFCSTETELNFLAGSDNEKAGLVIFQDGKHVYFLSKSTENGAHVLQLFKSNADSKNMDELAKIPLAESTKIVQLRIDAAGEFYSFHYAIQPGKWQVLKDKADAKFLSTKLAGGFIGCFFGMYATSSGKSNNNSVSFKYLR